MNPVKNTKPKIRVIPPRALRSDVPGGTVWVPRWNWAGRLFGRQVQLPATIQVSAGPPPAGIEPPAETVVDGAGATAAPVPAPTLTTAKSESKARAKTAPEPESQPSRSPASWGQWAYPLLAIMSALVVSWSLGATFGYLWAAGSPPPWLRQGVPGALLMAPSGSLLLILAGFGCLVQAADDLGTRLVWQATAIGFFLFSALAVFGGLL